MLYKTGEDADVPPPTVGLSATEDPTSADGARNVAIGRPLILLVDDDFALRGSLAEYLMAEGFDVECAANGLEGLRRLESTDRRPPFVVLLDMMMPYMSGMEFCERKAALPGLARIPVIATTGVGVSKKDLGALGLHGAFSKPLNISKLLQTVRGLIQPA